MLRACRRVLRHGGRLAFTVIEFATGLPPRLRRRALPAAPRAVTTRRPYVVLLGSAGFTDIDARDLTAEYRATTEAWLAASLPRVDELAAVDSADVVAERIQGWHDAIAALDAGWLRRTLYSAIRP